MTGVPVIVGAVRTPFVRAGDGLRDVPAKELARRVIREYKRFTFLAMEAGHPVTPSDPVDQA